MATKSNKWVKLSTSNKKVVNKKVKTVKSKFADLVREMRIKKGISQGHLAVLVGVDRKTINRIENGHFSPNLENLVRIFNALDIKPQKVFTA